MAIFNNPIAVMAKHRLTWLNAKATNIAENIARADIRGAFRREIKDFNKIVSENSKKVRSTKNLSDSNHFVIDRNDFVQTNHEIERELENLELGQSSAEHEALVSLIKGFHSMYKLVVAKGG